MDLGASTVRPSPAMPASPMSTHMQDPATPLQYKSLLVCLVRQQRMLQRPQAAVIHVGDSDGTLGF